MTHIHPIISAAVTGSATTTGTVLFAMTDQVQIYVIGTLATLIGTAFTGYLAYKSKKFSEDAKVISQEAKTVSEDTGKAVNGKMEEFKKLAEAYYLAKGKAEGVAEAETKIAVVEAAKAEGKAAAIAGAVPGI